MIPARFNSLKRVTHINIQQCYPDLSPKAQDALTQQSLFHTCFSVFDMARAWRCPAAHNFKYLKKISGFEAILSASQGGHGVILLSPHLGNWELVNLFVATQLKISILYREPKQAYLDAPIRKARERLGTDMAPANAQGVRHLFKVLKQGGVIGVLPDQDPGESGGQYAPFFKIPVNTMTLVSKLAYKSQAPVYFIIALRLPQHQGFEIQCVPAHHEIHSPDLTTSLNALNQGVEACIALAPEQYQWGYKRFKRSALVDLYP